MGLSMELSCKSAIATAMLWSSTLFFSLLLAYTPAMAAIMQMMIRQSTAITTAMAVSCVPITRGTLAAKFWSVDIVTMVADVEVRWSVLTPGSGVVVSRFLYTPMTLWIQNNEVLGNFFKVDFCICYVTPNHLHYFIWLIPPPIDWKCMNSDGMIYILASFQTSFRQVGRFSNYFLWGRNCCCSCSEPVLRKQIHCS